MFFPPPRWLYAFAAGYIACATPQFSSTLVKIVSVIPSEQPARPTVALNYYYHERNIFWLKIFTFHVNVSIYPILRIFSSTRRATLRSASALRNEALSVPPPLREIFLAIKRGTRTDGRPTDVDRSEGVAHPSVWPAGRVLCNVARNQLLCRRRLLLLLSHTPERADIGELFPQHFFATAPSGLSLPTVFIQPRRRVG